jgi:hypothetical protein
MSSRPIGMLLRTVTAALLALVLVPDAARSQSLADVAEREQARRKAAPSGRVYTDADLPPVSRPAPPPPVVPASPADTPPAAEVPNGDPGGAGAGTTEAPVEPGAPGTVIEGREKRDEEYWRNRARDVRGRLARATADVEAAERRLAEIDTGGQISSPQERRIVAAALERLRANVGFLQEEVALFEARARVENVPEEWTR